MQASLPGSFQHGSVSRRQRLVRYDRRSPAAGLSARCRDRSLDTVPPAGYSPAKDIGARVTFSLFCKLRVVLVRFSHRMLTIAVLLIGGLMAVSEAPEILTLTDNVTNDCESVQIAQHGARRCIVENRHRQDHPRTGAFERSGRGPRNLGAKFLARSFGENAS